MARKSKKSKKTTESRTSIFDDRRVEQERDKHIVVVERRQSRFSDDSAWYLKATIPLSVEPVDNTSDSLKKAER